VRQRGAVILLAGHYCHDRIIARDGSEVRTLGGAAAYAAAILDAFGEPFAVAAKVGADFSYGSQVSHPPRVVAGRTTSFVDDYRGGERRERVEAVCAPLSVDDLPAGPFEVGLALGVAGEVPLAVLARMRRICRFVLADAQSLLRSVQPSGEVRLQPLDATTVEHLDYLKASLAETAVLDVPWLRARVSLLVTDGRRGCRLLDASRDLHLPALPADERDPTGAGDCFLAGFALGLARGLDPRRAAELGAFCGARAVEQVGVPRLSEEDIRAAPMAARP
jgi:1D-myo-inositol 3-kinase